MVPTIEGEWERKRRMMSHAWPIVLRGGLLDPRGYGALYAFMIASHRALRYGSPFLHVTAFLSALADAGAAEPPRGGDAWQNAIFSAAESAGLPAGRAFAALYLAFLGRANGPRAGSLLASLEPDFVVDRLRAAAAAQPSTVGGAP